MVNQEQHEVVSALKDLAVELGRTPLAEELRDKKGISKHKIIRLFGAFSVAIKAAGLEKHYNGNPAKRKVPNDIFERDLEPLLELERARQCETKYSNFILPAANYPLTVALGDFHAPFHHVAATEFALEVIRELKPKRVVQGGDLYDMFSASKYPRSQNIYMPKDELKLARKASEKLWTDVQEASPGVECYQLLGNHDARPYKRVLETCPELEMFIDLTPIFTFPGVKLIADPREELNLDGVFYHHGYKTKLGDNRDFMNACAVAFHTHRGGSVFRGIWGGHQIWELNAGTLGDPSSKALSYTPQKHTQQTLGVGVIDKYGPRFIPFQPKVKK